MIKYVKIKIWYHNSLLFDDYPVNGGKNVHFSDGIVGGEKCGIFDVGWLIQKVHSFIADW